MKQEVTEYYLKTLSCLTHKKYPEISLRYLKINNGYSTCLSMSLHMTTLTSHAFSQSRGLP